MHSHRFVLWGSSGHAKVLASAIEALGGKVVALFDNDPNAKSVVDGAAIYHGVEGFRAWCSTVKSPQNYSGLVAIGGANGSKRSQISTLFKQEGIQLPVLIHPRSYVCPTAIIGSGSQILGMACIASGAKLGANCIVNHKASVDHECEIANGAHIAPGATLCGCVKLDENAFVGAGAVVLPRVRLGADCIIGAGSVVTKDVPERSVVAGNPAKYIRKHGE